ncbi:hypothetical protein T439DRAFT_330225 [Meredithblackwellia eburnea MCA 4105]
MVAATQTKSARNASTSPKRESAVVKTVDFNPSLQSTIKVTTTTPSITSVAVSFPAGGVIIHTQLKSKSSNIVVLRLTQLDPSVQLPASLRQQLWNALFPYVSSQSTPSGDNQTPELEIELPLPSPLLHSSLLALGATLNSPNYSIQKSAVWEQFAFALPTSASQTIAVPFPTTITVPLNSETKSLDHPLREPKPVPGSEVYSRWIPTLGQHFKLSAVEMGDATDVHRWMNDERVNKFWREAGTFTHIQNFLDTRITKDRHTLSVIGSYVSPDSLEKDDKSTYSEIYWAREDKLAWLMTEQGVAEVGAFDRGIHVLSGTPHLRGPHRVAAWLPSLIHYVFLSSPLTQKVWAEPNELNEKMIAYFENVGGMSKVGKCDMGHKTAQVLVVTRDEFYTKVLV